MVEVNNKAGVMKIVKVRVEGNQEFEIKVEDKDLDALIKVIKVFEIKEIL